MIEEANPLHLLLVSEAEERAYYKGRADEAHQHKCLLLSERPYPKAIMSGLDDIADAAYAIMGNDTYSAVQAMNDWLVGIPD